jgi:arginine decarboxylase
VLNYVHYDLNALQAQIRRECEKAVRLKQMTASESQSLVRLYESGINGYTYLEPDA